MLQAIFRAILLADKDPEITCNFDFKNRTKQLEKIDWKLIHESFVKQIRQKKVVRPKESEELPSPSFEVLDNDSIR